jgi:hypothetical protein
MGIEKFLKIIKFFWYETEIEILIFIGVVISVFYFLNPETSLASFAIWMVVMAVIYVIFWLIILTSFILSVSSGQLGKGGLQNGD